MDTTVNYDDNIAPVLQLKNTAKNILLLPASVTQCLTPSTYRMNIKKLIEVD